MNCAWKELLALIPEPLRQAVDRHRQSLQEVRLRLGRPVELVTGQGSLLLPGAVAEGDLRFPVNAASRYSPWAAESASLGYITAPGGHRLGLCGTLCPTGIRDLTSVNIRVARDFPGLADRLEPVGNVLILGPPGSGKTTLLRDLVRKISRSATVAVVDQRGELFPSCFDPGPRTDVLTGCEKAAGIDKVLRTMGPEVVALDEITAREDCSALEQALWCGVRLIASAHASGREDLLRRPVYRPLAEAGCFETLVILQRDKTWYTERTVL